MVETYRVIDGSYALASVEGEMTAVSGNDLFHKEFLILAENCDLPTGSYYGSHNERNNTILISVKNQQIVFTQRRFLRKIKYCPNCGFTLEEEGTH